MIRLAVSLNAPASLRDSPAANNGESVERQNHMEITLNTGLLDNMVAKVSPLQLSRLIGADMGRDGHARLFLAVQSAIGQLNASFKRGKVTGGKTKSGEYSATANVSLSLAGKSNLPLRTNSLCAAIVRTEKERVTEDGFTVNSSLVIDADLREWLVGKFADKPAKPSEVTIAPATVSA